MTKERGQALTEYILGVAAIVIVALSGAKILGHAINTQWNTLATWLILPSP